MIELHRAGSAFIALAVLAAPAVAAADEEPREESLLFDAELNPNPDNPALKDGDLSSGSTLVVRIDPTRLFGSANVTTPGLAMPTNVSPELKVFYVAAGGTRLAVQKGQCTVPVPPAAAVAPPKNPPSLECSEITDKKGWQIGNGMQLYQCPSAGGTLGELIDKEGGDWSLVQSQNPRVAALDCRASFQVTKDKPISSAEVSLAVGGEEPKTFGMSQENGFWTAKVPLTAGVARLRLRVKREGGQTAPKEKSLAPFKVAAADTHSLVRVQAELLATNRFRSVSYAVAITPVKRAFFTEGPWHCGLLCTISPTILFRLSGEDTTNFQLGAGAAVFVTRTFHLNGGFLFGTKDLTTTWRPERSWFVGVGIDPFILTETQTIATKGK